MVRYIRYCAESPFNIQSHWIGGELVDVVVNIDIDT